MHARVWREVPDISDAIRNGICDQYDIVHSKTSEGVEGSWGRAKIVTLKDAVLGFSGELNDRILELSAH